MYYRGTTGVVERDYTYDTYDTLGRPLTRRTARQGRVMNDSFSYNNRSESPRRPVGGLDKPRSGFAPKGRAGNGVPASQLTAATVNSQPYSYAYDNDADGCKASRTNTKCLPAGREAEGRLRVNIGNRKSAQEAADEATAYTANSLNQYTAIDGFTPTYDLDGKSPDGCKGDWTNREACLPRRGEPPLGRRRINQTLVKTATDIWAVQYSADNRPILFTRTEEDGTETQITCTYDHLGRRATKKVTVGGAITLHQRYLYYGYLQTTCCDLRRSGEPCLWHITRDPTQETATRPLSIRKDGTWYCYGWDTTKNVCEVFKTNGGIGTTYSYTPYGLATTSGSITQPLQWSSEYADTETALIYYNYRHYNPVDGRWLGRDVIGEDGGMNLYAFVQNQASFSCDFLGASILDRVTQSTASWKIAIIMFLDWIANNHDSITDYYAGKDKQADYMRDGVAGQALMKYFKQKNLHAKTCSDWESMTDVDIKFPGWHSLASVDDFSKQVSRFIQALPNGVESFVGTSKGYAIVSHHGQYHKVSYRIENKTTTTSFFLHLVKEYRNGIGENGYLSTWLQRFHWEEPLPCECNSLIN